MGHHTYETRPVRVHFDTVIALDRNESLQPGPTNVSYVADVAAAKVTPDSGSKTVFLVDVAANEASTNPYYLGLPNWSKHHFFCWPLVCAFCKVQLEACREPAANVAYWPTEEPDCQWATGWGAFQLVGNNDFIRPSYTEYPQLNGL